MADEFNDFEESGEEPVAAVQPPHAQHQGQPGQFVPVRVRIPRGKEVLGKVEQRVGANRMIVACFDGKTRNCRVPGRLKRRLWIRPGNMVLVEPWEFEGDKKGDIIFSYTAAEIQALERKGFMKGISEEF
jgi:translation initiation factor 1A